MVGEKRTTVLSTGQNQMSTKSNRLSFRKIVTLVRSLSMNVGPDPMMIEVMLQLEVVWGSISYNYSFERG